MNDLKSAIAHWNSLADAEVRGRNMGICVSPGASMARERIYRRTAESLRIELRTGVAVCSCCHKPFGRGCTFLESR